MPVGNMQGQQGGQPDCWGSLKMGFMMGFTVGMGAGAIFGTVGGLRMGAQRKRTDGKYR